MFLQFHFPGNAISATYLHLAETNSDKKLTQASPNSFTHKTRGPTSFRTQSTSKWSTYMLNSDPVFPGSKPETRQMKLTVFITKFPNTQMLCIMKRKTATKILLHGNQTKISQTSSWAILKTPQKHKENSYWNKWINKRKTSRKHRKHFYIFQSQLCRNFPWCFGILTSSGTSR